ncbi:hypothetical protein SISSUDRAFT_1064960 [Sistotremastrum suecicum HHB10207 ss-3]|uniref:Isomerase YbhE n=1 Tax=Sistotremastrum suecicum HHB10207 ss-3 TaxID=1314776 RepID=A0A166A1T4_9AGAM|nr:hypothetical protein SISSUDRAFT_1064960 [Sistotremastrum suecicum HHB10207 ss-3]
MSKPRIIVVGSYTDAIHILKFTPPTPGKAGSLVLASSVKVGRSPSLIDRHPTEANVIFAALENDRREVVSVKIDDQGKGKEIQRLSALGEDSAHYWVGPSEVVVANYSSSSVLRISFASEHPQLNSSFDHIIPFDSHPVQFSSLPSDSEDGQASTSDFGVNMTSRLVRTDSRTANGGFREKVAVETGSGPRHLIVHEEYLYMLAENSAELLSFIIAPVGSAVETVPLRNIPTTSHWSSPHTEASELVIRPQLDPYSRTVGTHILVSHRNDRNPRGDAISIFTPYPHFEQVGEVRPGLRSIEGMRFSDDGKYLIVGGVEAGGVKIFEWNGKYKEGWMKEVACADVESPSDFLWI